MSTNKMHSDGWTLVTGGAKGLGAALCLGLASQGENLLVHYRSSRKEAAEVVQQCLLKGVKAQLVQGDFSSAEATLKFAHQLLTQFPDIKHLINNVGSYLIKSPLETEIEEWNQIFQSNLNTPFILSRTLCSSIKNHEGAIINMGVAGAGLVVADTYATAYRIAKNGLLLLTKSLAKELAADQVRVNMVSPGYLENSVDFPSDRNKLPMGWAHFSDVVNAVTFLLRKESRYITGQHIEVAGGVRL